MIYARNYGATFNGVNDDTAALQAAIDDAHRLGEPLILPSGVAMISAALDLRGRMVQIYGSIGRTELCAQTPGMTMINVDETEDLIYSPFLIEGVYLNGNNRAAYGMKIRYRHHSELRHMLFQFCTEANVWEVDTWISRRVNCRSAASKVGWQLEGSSFDSAFYNCYNVGCSRTQWLLNNHGETENGNNSLLFSNCGATDATGSGMEVNGHVVVNLQSCYWGENCDGPTIVNNGGTVVFEGGTLSFGWKPSSYLVLPIGGETVFEASCQLNGQDFSTVDRLAYLTPSQVAAGSGTFRLDDAKGYMKTGGDPILPGDPVGYGAQRQVLVPRLGRQFQPLGHHTAITTTNPTPNSLRVSCNSVAGGNPIIGMFAPLSLDYRVGEPFYLLLVYRSSKPLQVRIDASPLGAPVVMLSFPPASETIATHVKVDAPIPAAPAGAVLDILMPGASANDFLEISECFLTDSTTATKGVAPVNRLMKC
jgi:hypothetical protein